MMTNASRARRVAIATSVLALMTFASIGPAGAHPDDGTNPHLEDGSHDGELDPSRLPDRDAGLVESSELSNISDGPSAKVTTNLDVAGRGERNVADATTDVWSHEGYAYTGTFNDPCGGDPDAGIWVWDIEDPPNPAFVTVIQSPDGSRTNDVRVAQMNSGDVLVHSNEACDGGPGGFELYDVEDPTDPVHLASVQTDDVNAFLRDNFGFVDHGVHNLWLFTQGDRDYVAATVESEFGNFQIFDITDPSSPELVGWWGAEELRLAELGIDTDPADITEFSLILDLDAYLFSGFGASQNKFLHDVTISADGTDAYLANWDAGLVLLDISDVTDPQVVSVAIDPVGGSLDGEVNSHSVWPSEDGSIVVEGEEDFSAWEGTIPPTNLTMEDLNTIPATAVATGVGDDFEGSQTGNTGTASADEVVVTSGPLAGNTYPAVEFVGNATPFDGTSVAGDFVWIGRACDGDGIENPLESGDIAVVRRGACNFSEKAINAAAEGAAALVLANNQQSTPWSGLRIWDYSDPANPVLASTFNTECSASTEPSDECAANGTYSAHNVQVETRGNKVYAYVSWYWDGMLVLDVTDPEDPVEVARYLGDSPNDGLANDFWGVYKEPDSPWILGSDRNGGLYVFKEKGSGSVNAKGRP